MMNDPKGLIRESYAMAGISDAECRSILLDWALSLPGDLPPQTAIKALLAQYGPTHPDHPMTLLLTEGAAPAPRPRRAGAGAGRSGRRGG